MLSNADWAAWERNWPKTLWKDEKNQAVISQYLRDFHSDAVASNAVTPSMLDTAVAILLEDGQLNADRPPFTKEELLNMPREKYRYVTQKYGMGPVTRVLNGE